MSGINDLQPLPRTFYQPSAEIVAPALLGHWLIRNSPEGPCGGVIVETEAYLCEDPACHGFIGPTARNRVMFGPAGHAYVYLIYGYHYCVNAVCRPPGVGEAVLLRAIEPTVGAVWMERRRPVSSPRELTNGPAKLCQALDINRKLDGADLCGARSPLYIAKNPEAAAWRQRLGPVTTTTRVGLNRAAERLLRFYLDQSVCVSRRVTARRLPAGNSPSA